MMASWVKFCRDWTRKNKVPSDVRMTGIHISERDARDTYAELSSYNRYPPGPFEEITAMTVGDLTIEWEPEPDRRTFGWYGMMGA